MGLNDEILYFKLGAHVGHAVKIVADEFTVHIVCTTCCGTKPVSVNKPYSDAEEDDDWQEDDEFEPEEGDDDFTEYFTPTPTWLRPC